MRIAVKYCGGCNPSYRREEIEEVLRKYFQVSYADSADLIVCISGCKKGCAAERARGEFLHFDEKIKEEEIVRKVKEKLLLK
ncbi:MAG: hypothetical protein DSO00_00995 [Archaeoglobi archaeon]|jgi:hypothetical protein|nr:MAG: hypothetical protein DSO00_00995 [Archaeoglobi archaeon]